MEYFTIEGYRRNSKVIHANNGFYYSIKCARLRMTSLKCVIAECSGTGILKILLIVDLKIVISST